MLVVRPHASHFVTLPHCIYNTWSVRDGSELVRRRNVPPEEGPHVLPYVEEIERILGFNTGDTDAPELASLTPWFREVARRGVLGKCSDARVLTFIFGFLPWKPHG